MTLIINPGDVVRYRNKLYRVCQVKGTMVGLVTKHGRHYVNISTVTKRNLD